MFYNTSYKMRFFTIILSYKKVINNWFSLFFSGCRPIINFTMQHSLPRNLTLFYFPHMKYGKVLSPPENLKNFFLLFSCLNMFRAKKKIRLSRLPPLTKICRVDFSVALRDRSWNFGHDCSLGWSCACHFWNFEFFWNFFIKI
jgi:hypothetical protein